MPDYSGIEVTVDAVEVTDEDVDEPLEQLRERFATLTSAVERAAADGDFVVDRPGGHGRRRGVEDGVASGVSYQVGSRPAARRPRRGRHRPASAGEAAPSPTELDRRRPRRARRPRSRSRSPASRSASCPSSTTTSPSWPASSTPSTSCARTAAKRLERQKKFEQATQARDKVLEALLELVDVPLPEGVLEAEIEARKHNLGTTSSSRRA